MNANILGIDAWIFWTTLVPMVVLWLWVGWVWWNDTRKRP